MSEGGLTLKCPAWLLGNISGQSKEILTATLRSTPQYCPSALARTMSSPVPVGFVLAWTKDATMSMTVMTNQVYFSLIKTQIGI